LREPWNNNSGEGGHGESSKSSKSHGTGQQAGGSGGSNSVSMNYNSPIWLSDEIEYWPDTSRSLKFISIAAMHSELIALGINGQIYQWKWIDIEPYRNPEVYTQSSVALDLLIKSLKVLILVSVCRIYQQLTLELVVWD